jgi:hypothetical protein
LRRLRPKLLLQLQQISQMPRPVPVLDVLTSTGFNHRLAYKPRIFRGRDGLGPKDLVVVTSDSYLHQSLREDDRSISSDDESSAHREVVATICYPSKEDARHKSKVEISLHSGRSWEATPLPNGSYEFVSRGKEGAQTVRWVNRRHKRHRLSTTAVPSPTDGDQRYTFSIIDPSTRRHPVIASMNRTCIDVYEQYSIPPASSGDGTISPDSLPDAAGFLPAPGQRLMETDDELRTVILVTGIWVACRESWSRNFPPVDSIPRGISPVSSPGSQQRSSFTLARNGRDVRVSSPGDVRFSSRPPPVSTVHQSPSSGVPGSQPRPVRAGESTARRTVRRSMSTADRAVSSQTPRELPAAESSDLPSPASRRRGHHHSDGYSLLVSGSHNARNSISSGAPSSDATLPKAAETDRAKGSRWRRISAVFDFGNRKKAGTT